MNKAASMTNDSFKVLVKLYRRLSDHRGEIPTTAFMLWGYFDGMSFQAVKTLEQFYNDDDIDNYDKSYEIHRMCLYSCNGANSNNANGESIFNIKKDKPLIVLSEFQVDGNIGINGGKNKLDSFQEKIESNIEQCRKVISEGNCERLFEFRVFRTLGYGEYVVVFRSSQYQHVADVLNLLRDPGSYQQGDRPLIKSSYSISGVHVESLEDFNAKEKSKVSVRLAFRDIEQVPQLLSSINEINKIKPKSRQAEFGKYDLRLLFPDVTIKEIVDLYTGDAPLNPNNPIHKNALGFVNTHWPLNGYTDQDNPLHRSLKGSNLSEENKNTTADDQLVNNLISKYIKFEEMLPKDFYKTIRQLIINLIQIEKNNASHSILILEVKEIMRDFLTGIEQTIEKMNRANDDRIKKEYGKALTHSIDSGLQIITQLMASRIQSFRLYSEIPAYDVQLVQSSTKLYLMYMKIVEDIRNTIRKITNSKLNFFVDLDCFGKVSSSVLFPNIPVNLIAIKLSIASLTNMPYNIFLLFHEISHHLPPRNSKEKAGKVLDVLCHNLAAYIVRMISTGDKSFEVNLTHPNGQDVTDSLIPLLAVELKKLIVNSEKYHENTKSIDYVDMIKECIDDNFSYLDESIEKKYIDYLKKLILFFDASPKESKSVEKAEEFAESMLSLDARIWDKVIIGEKFDSLNDLFVWQFSNEKLQDMGYLAKASQIKDLSAERKSIFDDAKDKYRKKREVLESFIRSNWLPVIQQTNKLRGKKYPNHKVLSHLSRNAILEGAASDEKRIVDAILAIFQDSRKFLYDSMDKTIYLINEFVADFLMVQLLGLDWSGYFNMLLTYHDSCEKRSAESEIMELGYRRVFMLKAMHDILEDQETLQEYDIENKKLEELFRSFPINIIADYYMSKAEKSQIDNIIESSKSLSKIRKYIKDFIQQSYNRNRTFERNFDFDIPLIEELWTLDI